MSVVAGYPTEREIRLLAFRSVREQLGTVGLIRFIQQLEQGQGDYTQEQYVWLGDFGVDELFDEI